MKSSFLAVIAAAGFLFVSCQKEQNELNNNPASQNTNPEEYYPMSVGSYWIYDIYKVDSNGVETKENQLDSVYVEKDTVISGKTYQIIKGTAWATCFNRILRDSSGYLVNPNGLITFAPDDFRNPIDIKHNLLSPGDTLYTATYYMEWPNDSVSVPAGKFDALAMHHDIDIKHKVSKPHRDYHEYRARNVGTLIYQTGFSGTSHTLEFRLARYHIQ